MIRPLLAALVVLASCDAPEAPDASAPIWSLSPCAAGDGGALFLGGPETACVRDGTLYEGTLPQRVGLYSTSLRHFELDGRLHLVLQSFGLSSGTYALDLETGETELLSVAQTRESQVMRAPGDRLLVADFAEPLPDGQGVLYITLSEVSAGGVRALGTAETSDVGPVRLFDSVLDAGSSRALLLALDEASGQYVLMEIGVETLEYRFLDIEAIRAPDSVAILEDGTVIVLDATSGELFAVGTGPAVLVGSLGPRRSGEPTLRVLHSISGPDGGRGAIVFDSNAGTTTIYSVAAGGVLSPLHAVDHTTRYTSVSPDGERLCGREFPFYETDGAVYEDRLYILDLATGHVRRDRVELQREVFYLPAFFCL